MGRRAGLLQGPTHYHVLLDEIGFSPDDLQELVHSLSYVYQRSTTAISVVAPIGYAHLATSQMGQFIKFEDRSESSSANGGVTAAGSIHVPELPRLNVKVGEASAIELTQSMDTRLNGRIWGALLVSCRTHSDLGLDSFAALRLLDLEPGNAGYQVVLSNIHSSHGTWDEAESIRKFMGGRDFMKMPGWSCIEVQGGFRMFVAGDRSHLQSQEIVVALGRLTVKIIEASCCM